MKIKVIFLTGILSLCTTSIVAQAIPENSMERAYYLKARNSRHVSVNKNAVATIFRNGVSYSSACINKNYYSDCERLNNTVFELYKICKKYNYKLACNKADILLDYDFTQRTLKIKI